MVHNPMSYNTWEDHASRITNRVSRDIFLKYDAGQREHGGQLWRKRMMGQVRAEALDLIVYIETLDDQLAKILADSYDPDLDSASFRRRVQNILEYGNPEGIEEEELSAGLEAKL